MALGPRLDIRQTQALVLTPQLQQAIRLLQLSNLELEAVIAEEMAKNPLLEAASGDDEAGPPPEAEAEIAIDSLEEPTTPGADELMVSLRRQRRSAARLSTGTAKRSRPTASPTRP